MTTAADRGWLIAGSGVIDERAAAVHAVCLADHRCAVRKHANQAIAIPWSTDPVAS